MDKTTHCFAKTVDAGSFPWRQGCEAYLYRCSWTLALLAVLFLVCAGSPVSRGLGAASADFVVRNWMNEDGLPQASVTSIIQTRDGYLWLGTFNGLVRFDGVRFTTFTTVNTPDLPSDWITFLFEDGSGYFWIGTRSGLACWRDGKLVRASTPAKLDTAEISRMVEPQPGTLIVSTDRGIFRLGTKNEEIPVPEPEWPTRQSWLTLAPDGTIWLAHRFTLYTISGGELVKRARYPVGIHSLSMTPDGTQWAVLENDDIWQWLPDGRTNRFQFPGASIAAVFQARNGVTWAGGAHGIYHWNNGELRVPSTVPTKIGDRVIALTEDREGIVWVGSDGGGLHRLAPNPVATMTTAEGLGYDDIATLWQDTTGEIWAGAFLGGLNRFESGRWTQVVRPGVLERDASVTALARDRAGTLWIGGYGSDLRRMKNGEIAADMGITVPVRVLFEDRAGRMWVGTENGIIRADGAKVDRITMDQGLSANVIRGIGQDRSGAIWIGTERGLNRVDDAGIKRFFAKDGLGADFVQALAIDADGTIWIGTAGGGLTRYQNGRFATLTTRRGLFNDVVSQIIEDDSGHLWMGSNAGIFRARKQAIHDVLDGKAPAVICTAFGKGDGLRHLECAGGFQPSCQKMQDGKLWFSTVGGIVLIDPKNLRSNESPPVNHIERIILDGESVLPMAGSLAVGGSSEAHPVIIPPGLHRLEIHYTGLNFRAPEQVQFKYRLAGYDDRWEDAGTRRAAYFNRVAPGRYRFQVMAANNQGVWSEGLAELPIVFQPYYWQTFWFRTAALAIAASVLYWVYHARKLGARRVQQIRLRIAQDLHDEVGSNLGNIALLSQLARKASPGPELIAELDEIEHVARQTVSAVRDVAWFINPEFDTIQEMRRHLEGLAHRLFPGGSVDFKHSGEPGDRRLSITFRRNLFFIFKEALHNAAKHSQATLLEIHLALEQQNLVLTIRDHGVGFDPAKVEPGSGMANLRRRALEIRGHVDIISQPGQGASIVLRAPLM